MVKKYTLCLLFIFFLMFSSALEVIPEKTIFPKLFLGDKIEYSFTIHNNDKFPSEITLIPENMLISFEEGGNFIIGPFESKDVNYVLNVNETGEFEKTIKVSFKTGNETKEIKHSFYYSVREREGSHLVLYFSIAILIGIIIFIVVKRGKKKKDE